MAAAHGGQYLTGREEQRAAVVIGLGVGETAEEPGGWVAGALVVLMRAKDKALGFCSELSTAAVRW
jgi:hypothetical protein